MIAGVKEAPPLWGWSLYPGNVQVGGLTTSLTPINTQSYGKEIQPVHSAGDQPWVFFGRNDAKAETPVLWPPHAKS